MMTIITNALRRAEEIALAAESRAFSPQCARPAPIKRGYWDGFVISLGFVSFLIIIFLPFGG